MVAGCTAFWTAGSFVMHLADTVVLFPIGVLFVAVRFGLGPPSARGDGRPLLRMPEGRDRTGMD